MKYVPVRSSRQLTRPRARVGAWVAARESQVGVALDRASRHYALVRLTKAFGQPTFIRALESWQWLGIAGKTPILASLFGDVILQDPTGYWFLDSVEGRLSRPWASQQDIQATLDTEEGQDQYLLGGLAMAAEASGLRLSDDEVYAFKVPPVLGGALDLANVEVSDFVVAVNLAGRLHDQVKNVPPGTRISGFQIDN